MEREFTNALSNTPLWRFALSVYSEHQSSLLSWQNRAGANVNRILALAFAVQQERSLPATLFQDPLLLRLEAMIDRVRELRSGLAGEQRELAKRLELELEGLHIQALDASIQSHETRLTLLSPNDLIVNYEHELDTEKGALAPFIATLLV